MASSTAGSDASPFARRQPATSAMREASDWGAAMRRATEFVAGLCGQRHPSASCRLPRDRHASHPPPQLRPSAVDLTPSTVSSAYATGLGTSIQVGYGVLVNSTANHAFLWRGSSASWVDLHPLGFADSYVRASHGIKQVGFGHQTGTNALHALLWKGTAASVVDLHQFAPASYSNSEAFGMDPAGDIVGAAYSTTAHTWHAVLWIPTLR